MTRVDFYICKDAQSDDWQNIACRLTEKAWRAGHSIYIQTASEQHMQDIDKLLWSFRPNSFVAHRRFGDNNSIPAKCPDILVSYGENIEEHRDLLINLSDKIEPFFSSFKRVAEIVSADEEAKKRSRQRYSYYRDRGHPLHVHDI